MTGLSHFFARFARKTQVSDTPTPTTAPALGFPAFRSATAPVPPCPRNRLPEGVRRIRSRSRSSSTTSTSTGSTVTAVAFQGRDHPPHNAPPPPPPTWYSSPPENLRGPACPQTPYTINAQVNHLSMRPSILFFYWPMTEENPTSIRVVWDKMFRGSAVYISEQLAEESGLDLYGTASGWRSTAGVYSWAMDEQRAMEEKGSIKKQDVLAMIAEHCRAGIVEAMQAEWEGQDSAANKVTNTNKLACYHCYKGVLLCGKEVEVVAVDKVLARGVLSFKGWERFQVGEHQFSIRQEQVLAGELTFRPVSNLPDSETFGKQ